MRHRPLQLALLCLVTVLSSPLARARTATLLETDLSIRSGSLESVTESGLTMSDPDGRLRTIPIDRVVEVGIEPAGTRRGTPDTGEAEPVLVSLIDGQRVLVHILPSDDPDLIEGHAPGLGRLRIPLERIRTITRASATGSVALSETDGATADRITLSNGDRLSGFISSIGLEIEIEPDQGTPIRIPFDDATRIELANPDEPPLREAIYLTDTLGVILIAHAFRIDSDGAMTAEADAASIGLASEGAERARYTPDNARFASLRVHRPNQGVHALGRGTPDAVSPTGDRRWTPMPVTLEPTGAIGLPDIYMAAPASARYAVPAGSTAFASDLAHRGGVWTNCTARAFAELRTGERIRIGEQRISAENDRTSTIGPIAGPLPAGTVAVILEVDPGRYGAVQDAVVFTRPRVRVAR